MTSEMKEYWRYIKHTINPKRKAQGMKRITFTDAKYLLQRIKLLGGKRG